MLMTIDLGMFRAEQPGGERSAMEDRSAHRAIGCASVIPAALIGMAGLADYAGPRGWRGICEFTGWGAVCVVAGLCIGLLLAQGRRRGAMRYAAVPFAVLAVAVFTYGPYWLGLHASMAAKTAFTTSLQLIGTLATGGTILWLALIIWTGRRSL